MSLLSYMQLCELVEQGVIDAPMSSVNGTSIDVTLHHLVRREVMGPQLLSIKIGLGESIITDEFNMNTEGNGCYVMMPDSVLLASTIEYFNMPLWLSAEFSLKSSLGRNFLGHELAGWIDPGFEGRVTLELKNNNQFHKLSLLAGMPIGQVKFFNHELVPLAFSYRTKGRYNGQDKATASLGVK